MTSILIISLPEHRSGPDKPARWGFSDGQTILEDGQFKADESPGFSEELEPDYVVVLMPAEDVFIARMIVPGRHTRQARQAAPYLIEDHLASPLDETSVFVSEKGSDEHRWVWAVSSDRLDHWMSFLADIPQRPLYALPDSLLLPTMGGDLTIFRSADRLLFNTRPGQLNEASRSSHDENGPDPDLPISGAILQSASEPFFPALSAALKPKRMLLSEGLDPGQILDEGQAVSIQRLTVSDLRLLAGSVDPDQLGELPVVFGEPDKSSLDWAEIIRPWKRTAVLALLAITVMIGLLAGQGLYYSNQSHVYQDATDDLILDTFPDITNRQLAQVLFQRKLNQSGLGDQGPGFLDLTAQLASVMEAETALQIESIRYDASRAALSITASYNDFSAFEAFREQAEAIGLDIEDDGARQDNGGFTGEFIVRSRS